jgi:hypothetical protein
MGDRAIDGNTTSWIDQDNVSHHEGIGSDLPRLSVASYGNRLGQEVQELADGGPTAGYGQVFQHFGNQHEERNDQRGEELADSGCGHDGDGHGEFHGHAAGQDIFERFLEDWPTADRES